MWEEYGFRGNPYSAKPVPPNDLGERILVGRSLEVRAIQNRISMSSNICTVEGANGVGKTSVAMQALYLLGKKPVIEKKDRIIPVFDILQISPTEEIDSFKYRFFLKLGQAVIDNQHLFSNMKDIINPDELRRWLSEPSSMSYGATIAGFGGQGARNLNSTSGFADHGIREALIRALKYAFSDKGGFLFILDNLEILNTSKMARETLE